MANILDQPGRIIFLMVLGILCTDGCLFEHFDFAIMQHHEQQC